MLYKEKTRPFPVGLSIMKRKKGAISDDLDFVPNQHYKVMRHSLEVINLLQGFVHNFCE